ncbi:MAG: HDOD domain-containing protein [Candidatus Eisenbacteria bacterium]|nr:HDOD domain-containing protein [Candidatus Eisenbacteria bacterium]
MIQLDELIKSAQELDPLPASVTRLASLVASENSDLAQIQRVVELDPALTGRLLKTANSAASAAVHPITTVRAAVMRLGSGAVLSLATATAVHGRMSTSVPEYGLGEGDLWHHALTAALAAENWARLAKVSVPPECFTAALLHDIGKLVLGRFLKPEVRAVLGEAMQEAHLSPLRAEMEVLGVHHAELGGLIAQNWKLPETIVAGITFHHDPNGVAESTWAGRPDVQAICDTVHLADATAYAVAEGTAPSPMDQSSLGRLGLSTEQFAEVVEKTREQVQGVLAVYK